MSEVFSIRLSNEEKDMIQKYTNQMNYHSQSDFIRELIRRGFQTLKLTPKEEHLLFNSAQTLLLLKDLVKFLYQDEMQSSQIINSIKQTSEEWTNKFNVSLR